MTKIVIFFNKITIGNFVEKKTIFVSFFEKNVKFFLIFWHSNGNFREGHNKTSLTLFSPPVILQSPAWFCSVGVARCVTPTSDSTSPPNCPSRRSNPWHHQAWRSSTLACHMTRWRRTYCPEPSPGSDRNSTKSVSWHWRTYSYRRRLFTSKQEC